jgi:hypothetical protein
MTHHTHNLTTPMTSFVCHRKSPAILSLSLNGIFNALCFAFNARLCPSLICPYPPILSILSLAISPTRSALDLPEERASLSFALAPSLSLPHSPCQSHRINCSLFLSPVPSHPSPHWGLTLPLGIGSATSPLPSVPCMICLPTCPISYQSVPNCCLENVNLPP